MSIYVRVGDETICVQGPGSAGEFEHVPIPVELLEREVENSKARQREARQLAFARSGSFVPIDERDVVVAERAFAAGRAAGALSVRQVGGASAEAVRRALEEAVEHCATHNREYHHVTPDGKLAEWRAALAGEAARRAPAPGRFVERKPRPQVDAVHWSGQNWPEVEAWLSGRVESAKLDPDDASVVVVWDEEARMRCRAGNWLTQRVPGGEVSTCPSDRFAKLYAPADSEDEAPDLELLVAWRRWARALLKEPGVAGLDDESVRRKISAVMTAPAVIDVEEVVGYDLSSVDGEVKATPVGSASVPTGGDLSAALSAGHKQLAPEGRHNPLVVEACCRVANAVYREALNSGDPMPSWDDASEDEKASERETVIACLSGVSPAAYHARWRVEKLAEGWRYDPVKSEEQKLHPNLVPYAQLPSGQRALDSLFVAAVKATQRALAEYEEAASVPVLSFNGNLPPEGPAAGWVNDPFKLLDEVGATMGRLTPGKLRELFAEHCECRPVNTARDSHSHDCDTDVTDDVRTLLHHVVMPEPGEMVTGALRPATEQEEIVARNRLATYVAEKARKQ